jgi:hypothetical protein
VTPAEICAELVHQQLFRSGAIRALTAAANRRSGLVRLALGFHREGVDQDAIKVEAARAIKAILKGKKTTGIPQEIVALVHALESVLPPLQAYRDGIEKEMKRLAVQLPVWPWVESVRGVGSLGLAVIVGETGEGGDIGAYRTVQGFWKRHGFAVIDGVRQQKRKDKDEAERHGYSPRRHAESWAFLQDVMLRSQWQGGEALGPYGVKYRDKKADYLAREDLDAEGRRIWTPLHADRAARRYAAKAFLTDLYYEWRRNQGCFAGEARRRA